MSQGLSLTACQCRQLSFIAEFTREICHIPGHPNIVEDTFSRLAVANTTNAVVAARVAVISPSSGLQACLAHLAATTGLHFQPSGPLAVLTIEVTGLQLPSSSAGLLPVGLAESSNVKQGSNVAGSLPFGMDMAEAQIACPDCR
jgi:hypothetical protein